MAYRSKLLHHRIKGQASNSQDAMGDALIIPMGDEHPRVPPVVPTPMQLPTAQVTVNPVDDNYVTLGMQDVAPLTTADGAMIMATGPGAWDQLALAGGGRHG